MIIENYGELWGDSEASGRFLPAAEAEDGGEARREADSAGTSLGVLLYHASQGVSQFRPRHSATRHRASQRCKFGFLVFFVQVLVITDLFEPV